MNIVYLHYRPFFDLFHQCFVPFSMQIVHFFVRFIPK